MLPVLAPLLLGERYERGIDRGLISIKSTKMLTLSASQHLVAIGEGQARLVGQEEQRHKAIDYGGTNSGQNNLL